MQDRRMVTMDHLYCKALVTNRMVTRVTMLIAKLLFLSTMFLQCVWFFEFNKLCSVYSLCKHSHGHFKACVWYAFYVCIT